MSNVTSSKASFSAQQIEFIVAVEKCWWESGALPTDEKLEELLRTNISTIRKYWQNDNVRGALMHRGVDLNPHATGLLTLQQMDLANVLLNYHDTSSLREKLNRVGVTSQQYHAWMRQQAFRDYVTKRAESMFKGSDHEAYQALTNAMRGGDMKATQMFFEMRGIYNPRVSVEVLNVQGVLVKMVEIISRHVRDPLTLQNIARDLEELGLGTNGSAVPAVPAIPARVLDNISSVPTIDPNYTSDSGFDSSSGSFHSSVADSSDDIAQVNIDDIEFNF